MVNRNDGAPPTAPNPIITGVVPQCRSRIAHVLGEQQPERAPLNAGDSANTLRGRHWVRGSRSIPCYWYDGASQGPTPQHITLADQADIKVRLGFVNPRGEQKGVDSLVMTDMLTLARNGAMAECVLFSGDRISGLACSRPRNTGSGSIFSGSGRREAASLRFFSRRLTRRMSGLPTNSALSSIAGPRVPSSRRTRMQRRRHRRLMRRLRTRCLPGPACKGSPVKSPVRSRRLKSVLWRSRSG